MWHITVFFPLVSKPAQDRERALRAQIDKLIPEIVGLQQDAIIEAPVNIDFLEESKAVCNGFSSYYSLSECIAIRNLSKKKNRSPSSSRMFAPEDSP